MNDPILDSYNGESDLFPAPEPQPKKGRLWPPILILCVLFTVGLLLFFLIKTPVGPITDPAIPWFSVQDGTLYFDEAKYTGGAEITVPASMRGQAVTALSDGCFANCRNIVTVYLPEGISTLGSSAFAGCRTLRGIKLPETLTSIGNQVFSGCSALEAVCIPYSVTQIGNQAFAGCKKLSHIFYTGPIAYWEAFDIEFPDANPDIYCQEDLFPQE